MDSRNRTRFIQAFGKNGLYFVVPLKCGFTAFCTAERRKIVQRATIPCEQQTCAVVRSPIARLKSFFTDKLQTHIFPERLQACQQAILDGLNLGQAENLRKLSFEEFVHGLERLPKGQWDEHIRPFSESIRQLNVTHLINLESPVHSRWLFHFLHINPDEPDSYNKTFPASSLIVSRQIEGLIHSMYAGDFRIIEEWKNRMSLPTDL
jgi:hypothetical protein